MTADSNQYPTSDLQPGGSVDPGATPPADDSTSVASDGRQSVPKRFSPTIVTVMIIVGIIILVAVAGGIAVIFDAFQLFT